MQALEVGVSRELPNKSHNGNSLEMGLVWSSKPILAPPRGCRSAGFCCCYDFEAVGFKATHEAGEREKEIGQIKMAQSLLSIPGFSCFP